MWEKTKRMKEEGIESHDSRERQPWYHSSLELRHAFVLGISTPYIERRQQIKVSGKRGDLSGNRFSSIPMTIMLVISPSVSASL